MILRVESRWHMLNLRSPVHRVEHLFYRKDTGFIDQRWYLTWTTLNPKVKDCGKVYLICIDEDIC